jgi:hypothetical protein
MSQEQMSSKILLAKILEFAFALTVVFLFAVISAIAQNGKRIQTLRLGETKIKVNIYQKRGSSVTFVALHHNEQISINIAKKFVEKRGGRLIELEALNEDGKPTRRLKFEFNNNSYSLDPNRIFTDNGRTCGNPSAVVPEIKMFADALLKIILPPDGRKLRNGEKFLISLHNNQNIDDQSRNQMEKERDLTAFSFIKGGKTQHPLLGQYQAQADGIFISNVETDEDNFIFLARPTYLSYFASKGFHVVLQKPAAKLKTPDCETDDGSLSVYFGQRNLSYIGLEADKDNGEERQTQMMEAIYRLVKK